MNSNGDTPHEVTPEYGPANPDLVPARMVNEFAYCPRLAYLEWVQGEFAVNADVAEGRYVHRAVDRQEGGLPDDLAPEDQIHARSVWLSAPSEFLSARIDLVETEGAAVIPVDYKRGAVPDLPERAWEADRVQVCAQALVLRANGYSCDKGLIYYAESKTRVAVPIDDGLVTRTRELVAGLRRMAVSAVIPPPLTGSPKCVRCSLNAICLPDEVNLVAGGCLDGSADDDRVRRLLPARDDALPLYVQSQGARLTRNAELFEVWLKDRKVGECRIFETSHVAIFGNVQVTTQALQEMCSRGIPLTLFSTGGWYYGTALGMPHKNVELRRAQYRTAEDGGRCLSLAQETIAAKIDNSRTMLMRNHPTLAPEIPLDMKRHAQAARKADSFAELLGIEGMAAKTYFASFSGMLKEGNGDPWRFDFNGRNRRPPLDPVNAMLSYAYSLLVKDITVTLHAVGFDPYLGFYHAIRYGKPALALDLMEEFRPIIADSVVLWTVNNRVLVPGDFIRRGHGVAMTPAARRKFITAYERRMDSLVTHPIFGYRISYRRVLEVQARLLGRHLLGEIPQYPSFRTR